MVIRCIRAYGNFKPGDEVEVPDGAVFDKFHFKAKRKPKPADEGESE